MKKQNMRQTQLGRVYARLADRFNIPESSKKILDEMLDEPDCEKDRFGEGLEWERRAAKLFPIRDTDSRLFISAMWGIVRDEVQIKRQKTLN